MYPSPSKQPVWLHALSAYNPLSILKIRNTGFKDNLSDHLCKFSRARQSGGSPMSITLALEKFINCETSDVGIKIWLNFLSDGLYLNIFLLRSVLSNTPLLKSLSNPHSINSDVSQG